MTRLRGLFILDKASFPLIYGPEERRSIERYVDFIGPAQTRASIARNRDLLASVEVIFSGWGAPMLDKSFLDAAPNFKAFFYGAGTVEYCLTDVFWERGITVTTAVVANSIPVAEYSLATILFSLKCGWRLAQATRDQRRFVSHDMVPGSFGSTIGLVSLGTIARILLKLLRPFDLNVIVYDPYLSQAEADALGVECVSLDELFRRSDVVSVHTPLMAETAGMIAGRHMASMKESATLINTARGEILRQQELIDVAVARPDLQFVLDVTAPEPPPTDSPLYTLPNILLTPHIAGSAGGECRRMGQYMVEELERYVAGESLKWEVTREPVRYQNNVSVFVQRDSLPRSIMKSSSQPM